MGLNKYFQKVMITFKQFLEEAKKKEAKKKEVKTKLSKNKVMKILDKQGGIGAKAVQQWVERNPNYGPRSYTLGDKI